MVIKDIVP